MADQLISLALAFLVFPLIIWVPGMVLGHSANLFEFRSRSTLIRIALGLLLSMAGCPILTYLIVRLGGYTSAWIFFGMIWIGSAAMLLRSLGGISAACREVVTSHKGLILLVCGWFVVASLGAIDLILPGGVYRSLITMDAVAHVAFTNSLAITGIPPANPFVHPGHAIPLFYYYFWYLLCSLVDQLGGSLVTAREAVQAGTIYVGLAVAALIAVAVEFLGPLLYPGLGRIRKLIGVLLLAVTGLDLLPWIFVYVAKRAFDKGPGPGVSIEHWNEQVTAWLGAILMSPHHPAALVMGVTGVLLLLDCMHRHAPIRRFASMALTTLAFASAAGTSLYVSLPLAVGLMLWAALAARDGCWRPAALVGLTGCAAVLVYLPFAAELRAAAPVSDMPLALTIRAFEPVDYWLPSVVSSLKGSPVLYLLRLLGLPLNYFMELGFFLLAAVLYWRWRRSAPRPMASPEVALCCLAAGSLLACTFLRSTFRWNDLGWRGFLVAQFVLLLWAIPVAQSLLLKSDNGVTFPTRWRRPLLFLILLGLAGTAWELVGYRTNFLGPRGPVTLGVRDAYRWVNRTTPPAALVLMNPEFDIDFFNTLYGHRLTVVTGRAYATQYAVDVSLANEVIREVSGVYGNGQGAGQLLAICARYGASVVVATAWDAAWHDRSSWVWKLRPSFANSQARVFLLGGHQPPRAVLGQPGDEDGERGDNPRPAAMPGAVNVVYGAAEMDAVERRH